MRIEEAKLYLEHTSIDDFKLEEYQNQNRYEAIKVVLEEIEKLNNIINEIEKEIDRLLERQYESERFAKEQGFYVYLPVKVNLLCIKNKLKELKGSDKNENN